MYFYTGTSEDNMECTEASWSDSDRCYYVPERNMTSNTTYYYKWEWVYNKCVLASTDVANVRTNKGSDDIVDMGLSVKWAKYNAGSCGPYDKDGKFYTYASVFWDSMWYVPTKEKVSELIANSTVERKTIDGVDGYQFTSLKNGNTLFFPTSRTSYYATSTSEFMWFPADRVSDWVYYYMVLNNSPYVSYFKSRLNSYVRYVTY